MLLGQRQGPVKYCEDSGLKATAGSEAGKASP